MASLTYKCHYGELGWEPLHPCPGCGKIGDIYWHTVDDGRPDGRQLATLSCGHTVALLLVDDGVLNSELVEA